MTAFPLPAACYVLPFAAPFRGLTQRTGMIISGPGGDGEFAPFPDYGPEQDAHWLAAAVEAACDPDPGPGTPVAANAILPDVADDALSAAVRRLLSRTGCTTLKVKVGGRGAAADLDRVEEVSRAAGAAVRLRLDGNGRFDVAAAREFVAGLVGRGLPVDYLEQPCRTPAELAQCRGLGIMIAADEALRVDRRFGDVREFADVAVVKVAPLGGMTAVARVVAALDVPVVISGAAESSVGLARDAVAAARFGDPGLAHGLGTGTLLAADVAVPAVLPRGGAVSARRVTADRDALAAARPDEVTAARWRDRLERAWRTARALDLAACGAVAP